MRFQRCARNLIAGLAATWLLSSLATSSAFAQSTGGTLSPQAKIRGHCSSATVTQPPQIEYDPISANLSAAATGVGHLLVTCTYNSIGTIDMDHGLNGASAGSSAYFVPQMVGTGTTPPLLQYFIYSSPGASGLWGTTTSDNGGTTAGSTVAFTGTGAQVDFPFYISIPPDQNVPADTYTDTVTATVSF